MRGGYGAEFHAFSEYDGFSLIRNTWGHFPYYYVTESQRDTLLRKEIIIYHSVPAMRSCR
jgi:hypothetical protein